MTSQPPMSARLLESVGTCPHCGHAKRKTMLTDACLFPYECDDCKTLVRPNRLLKNETWWAKSVLSKVSDPFGDPNESTVGRSTRSMKSMGGSQTHFSTAC